jgi:4-amino-4-deoxy-L-arabinose transferase-like glycosyltransferase
MGDHGAPASATPAGATAAATPTRVIVALLVAGAAWLRLAHIGAGIPYALGVDEPEIMERAVRMMKTGEFNPHFFDWPSLTIYLQFLLSCLTFLRGAMHGAWNNLDQIGAAQMYESGRSLTAAFGVATVWLTYLAGRRWGSATGVIAALLMAVMPYHVRESHYVLADVPTAFFTTLTLLLALRASERPTQGAFAWAGVAAGLAASSKYNGSIAIVMPLLAAWTGGDAIIAVQRMLVTSAAAAGAFLLGTPYALLDLPKFLNDYARLAAIFARPRGGEPGWSIYLKHLQASLGWPAALLAIGGGLVAARSWLAGREVRWAVLLVFPGLYFTVMARSYQIYGRYTLPLLPCACLMAAIGLTAISGLLQRTRVPGLLRAPLIAALALAALVTPTQASMDFDRQLGRTGTIDLAYRWIAAHVPTGTPIALETRALVLPPPSYPSINTRSLLEHSYDDYVAQGYRYLVASEVMYGDALAAPQDHRDQYIGYRTLFSQATEVASFPGSDLVPGPTLRILQIGPR